MLVTTLFLFESCPGPTTPSGGGGGGGESPYAVLTVTINANCSGKASNINVYIDNSFVATLQPAGSTSKTVTKGDHTVYAQSQEGSVWGPYTVCVQRDTSYDLYCT